VSVAEAVHLKREARVAWITLDRPPLNVMDTAMMRSLNAALTEADSADFVVFRGAGETAFSAGAEVADHSPERVRGMLQVFHGIFRRLCRAEAITIAAVHGHCLGGGCELATFCDFVLATESAQFGQPEIKLGCFPPVALVTLPVLAGLRAAIDLILTGRTISAREAQAMGLVTRVVPEGALLTNVEALLCELGARSPAALRITRRAIWRAAGIEFERRLEEAEDAYLRELMETEDAREGIRAFLEKRSPVWQGR
jgi:cyclohexa-1,5-dienecarbonyl-CoA hydratase